MNFFDELKWRDMVKDCSDLELAEKRLNSKQKLIFYTGYDPTGESLTVGHLVQVVRMRLMQKHGFDAICLIGGATGLIGDPREVGERKLLSLEKSLENADKIKNQLSRLLDPEKTTFVNNNEWLSKISLIEFLRDYGKNFNINYMLAKDIISRRLDEGISYTEFSYMLLQSIDFLYLYENYNCELQFGGSDQWGNLTAGLELIRKVKGDNSAFALSSPLLLKSDGKKFGKSEGGALWLDENLTSPYELYQYFLNTPDDDVVKNLKVLTLLEVEEINELEKKAKECPEQRQAQKVLAYEVVKFVHSEKKANQAIKITNALFNSSFDDLDEEEWQEVAKILKSQKVSENGNIIDCLVNLGLAQSKREAREFVNSKAIIIGNNKVEDINTLISKDMLYFGKYLVVKRGKKKIAVAILG